MVKGCTFDLTGPPKGCTFRKTLLLIIQHFQMVKGCTFDLTCPPKGCTFRITLLLIIQHFQLFRQCRLSASGRDQPLAGNPNGQRLYL